jgi:hypothetical protein
MTKQLEVFNYTGIVVEADRKLYNYQEKPPVFIIDLYDAFFAPYQAVLPFKRDILN